MIQIWVFGMVERETNTFILYPVADRSEDTLLPIIQGLCSPGSAINSGGWSAYCPLNSLKFQHFTVVHRFAFKKSYVNKETGENVEIHSNHIKRAWKHAKDHFKRMLGTKLAQFEGHMAEIMWRAGVKSNRYDGFISLIK